jgi:hypothetical protein
MPLKLSATSNEKRTWKCFRKESEGITEGTVINGPGNQVNGGRRALEEL